MRRLIFLLLISILISGCRTSLRSNWNNFNAYFNTFYNARQSYKAGLKKNLDQVRDYNPLQPIRIHEEPVNAGAQDFQKAINKGADILREHNESKWVDHALELIGKSFYFRQEYFSADQKFKELYTTSQNIKMQQNSVIWQGRVLLEMELYNEGIAYLNDQLTEFEEQWDKRKKAEVKTILAQHYVKQESWELARKELEEALPDLSQKAYKERGYFLLAQVYERLGDTQGAFEAYDKVGNYYTEYRIQYLANRKKAEVARNLGKNDVAYSLFSDMVRDDKNIEYSAELRYEMGKTDQIRGNYRQAEKIYKNLLHDDLNKPKAQTAALAYYGLAEIYRYHYDDFSAAAAYYDSAAQKNVPAEQLPEDFEANELADSFGEYTRLKSEIALQDSLLWLGQLSPEKFDSVIAEIRKRKIAELEALKKERESRENTMVNLNQDQGEEENSQTGSNGFLNSENEVQQQDARRQFFALWGNRPLVDYWRVNSLMQETISQTERDSASGPGNNLAVKAQGGNQPVEINLDQVPFTKAAQDSVRELISNYYYELGNLFFLSLNLPDSATHYFHKAVENPAKNNINAVSLYSLSEIEFVKGNEEASKKYAEQLMEQFPFSKYADRLSEKFNFEREVKTDTASVDTLKRYEEIILADSLSSTGKAERLKTFSKRFENSRLAPKALYEAIQFYMKEGKDDSVYTAKYDTWVKRTSEWEQKREDLKVLKDTASAALKDTSLAETERQKYQAVMDSTLSRPDFSGVFPYDGASWDSARSAIDEYLNFFRNARYTSAVNRLKKELSKPGEEQEQALAERPEAEEEQKKVETSGEYLDCSEIEKKLVIRGGKFPFMNKVNIEGGVPEAQNITYRFRVNQRGVVEGFELLTENVPGNIRSAYQKAINSNLSFEPVMHQGQATPVQCEMSFTVRAQSN